MSKMPSSTNGRGWEAIPLMFAALLLQACGERSEVRYRMTVEVETPQGPRTGSSVIESTMHDGPRTGQASGIRSTLRGQAVAIDLAGGTLFALLRSTRSGTDYHAGLLHNALNSGSANPPLSRLYGPDEWRAERTEARTVKPAIVLPPEDYPLFAWFRDVKDPKTIEIFDPRSPAAVLGQRIRIRRITLSVTDDKVSSNGKRLPYTNPDTGFATWYGALAYDDRRRVGPEDFSRIE